MIKIKFSKDKYEIDFLRDAIYAEHEHVIYYIKATNFNNNSLFDMGDIKLRLNRQMFSLF